MPGAVLPRRDVGLVDERSLAQGDPEGMVALETRGRELAAWEAAGLEVEAEAAKVAPRVAVRAAGLEEEEEGELAPARGEVGYQGVD